MTVQGDERCLNDVTLQMLYPHIADGISAARKSVVRCRRGTIASTRPLISQLTDGHQLARAHWAQKRLFEVRFTPMELPEMLHCRRRRKCAINGREQMQQIYSISSSGKARRGKNREQMNRQHKQVPTEEEGSVV